MATLKSQGFDAVAIPGDNGQFDVRADGRTVYSKEKTGRFPQADEVLSGLAA